MNTLFNRLCAFTMALALASSASANWHLKVRNNSQIPITMAQSIPANTALAFTGTLGNAVVVIPGKGVVELSDTGDRGNPCQSPNWGVRIVFNGQIWRFYYDGEGELHLTVNSDGTVAPTPVGDSSQLVLGDNPPACRR
jgi:hypothetical protein